MIEGVGLFMLYTAIVFVVIAIFGVDLGLKEKAKIFAGFEIFLALLIISAYTLVG